MRRGGAGDDRACVPQGRAAGAAQRPVRAVQTAGAAPQRAACERLAGRQPLLLWRALRGAALRNAALQAVEAVHMLRRAWAPVRHHLHERAFVVVRTDNMLWCCAVRRRTKRCPSRCHYGWPLRWPRAPSAPSCRRRGWSRLLWRRCSAGSASQRPSSRCARAAHARAVSRECVCACGAKHAATHTRRPRCTAAPPRSHVTLWGHAALRLTRLECSASRFLSTTLRLPRRYSSTRATRSASGGNACTTWLKTFAGAWGARGLAGSKGDEAGVAVSNLIATASDAVARRGGARAHLSKRKCRAAYASTKSSVACAGWTAPARRTFA